MMVGTWQQAAGVDGTTLFMLDGVVDDDVRVDRLGGGVDGVVGDFGSLFEDRRRVPTTIASQFVP
jgi:hypothetical protein